MKLDQKTFLEIVRLTPLVSIDLVVRNASGNVLLGLRSNQPARGMWFVPGGRLAKDERILDALSRQTQAELGLAVESADCQFLGVFEHLYPDNFCGETGISTHYIVLAYAFSAELNLASLPTDQHSEWRWWSVNMLLIDKQVHPNTQAYFIK